MPSLHYPQPPRVVLRIYIGFMYSCMENYSYLSLGHIETDTSKYPPAPKTGVWLLVLFLEFLSFSSSSIQRSKINFIKLFVNIEKGVLVHV